MIKAIATAALLSAFAITAAHAQDTPEREGRQPLRVRAGLGAQLVPSFPGSNDLVVTPFPDFAVTRGDDEFEFESPDESFGFTVADVAGIEVGPAITFQGSRRRTETVVPMDEIGLTIEAGGFAQIWLTPAIRLRTEARYGIGGHRSWTGSVGADYVIRDGDKYVFSVGPRVSLGDRNYQQQYFGVNAAEAVRTGLPAYRPSAGANAVGATSGIHYSLDRRWGLVGYVRYDRLIGDAADSPFIRTYGARDQLSGGVGLTYVFGR